MVFLAHESYADSLSTSIGIPHARVAARLCRFFFQLSTDEPVNSNVGIQRIVALFWSHLRASRSARRRFQKNRDI